MFLVPWILFGLAGGFIAARKGYSPTLGIILGVICGPLGLLCGLGLPMTEEGRRVRELERSVAADLKEARQNKTCPKCGCVHSVVNNFCPSCMFQYPQA